MAILKQIKDTFESNNWLEKHAQNIHSQFGEDGIIEKIFTIIKESDKFCVEFGAWDGKNLSNTYNLLANKDWNGVLIEASPSKFKKLTETYAGNSKVTCINKLVNIEGADSLENILRSIDLPKNFDLISIDVDGNDYHIWDSLKEYNPKVVIVEFNPTIPNDIYFVQDQNLKTNHGNSLRALIELGKSKEYELISTTVVNGIFVKKEYYHLFDISDNSIYKMYNPQPFSSKLFQLYDGTLILSGFTKLFWHGIPIGNDEIQILPRSLRKFPDRV